MLSFTFVTSQFRFLFSLCRSVTKFEKKTINLKLFDIVVVVEMITSPEIYCLIQINFLFYLVSIWERFFLRLFFISCCFILFYMISNNKSNQDNQSLKKVSRYQALKATTPLKQRKQRKEFTVKERENYGNRMNLFRK